jgi:hypothetical protein
MDSAGNAISVWQEITADRARNAVLASRYLAGGTWSTATAIDNPIGNAVQPQIAMAPDGVAVAAFSQTTANNGGGMNMITTHFTGLWGAPQRIDAGDMYNATDPSIALAPDGTATAVFAQGVGDPYSRAMVNRSTAPSIWSGRITVDLAGAISPQVATSNAHTLMTWVQVTGVSTRSLWSSNLIGGLWSSPLLITSDAHLLESPIRVALDTSGNATAVWAMKLGGRYEVRSARFDAINRTWGGITTLNNGTHDALEPQLGLDANGNVLVVWYESNLTAPAQSDFGVWSNRFSATSLTWGAATAVQPNLSLAGVQPSLGVAANGDAIAVWLQPSPANSTRSELWGSHFNLLNATWASPIKLMTNPDAYTLVGYDPKVSVNANGEAVVVWYERTDAPVARGVWARVYR